MYLGRPFRQLWPAATSHFTWRIEQLYAQSIHGIFHAVLMHDQVHNRSASKIVKDLFFPEYWIHSTLQTA